MLHSGLKNSEEDAMSDVVAGVELKPRPVAMRGAMHALGIQ